jgi:hypothetical protein
MMLDELTVLELSVTEDLDNLDEAECEWGHRTMPCTHHVTHRLRLCVASLNICDNAGKYLRDRIDNRHLCADCDRLTADCWTVTPI